MTPPRATGWPPRRHRPTPPLDRPLVLVGLMGAGKTTIGRRLAQRLEVPFHDMDQVIEERQGCSIADIFATKGEAYFRQCELETMDGLLAQGTAVIATGGGAFVQPAIRALVNARAVSLWLDAPLEVLLERVSRRNHRPLLEQGGDKRAILERLLAERAPAYAEAHLHITSGDVPHGEVVGRILKQLTHRRKGET